MFQEFLFMKIKVKNPFRLKGGGAMMKIIDLYTIKGNSKPLMALKDAIV